MNYLLCLKEAVGMAGRPASRMLSCGKCQLWKSIIVMSCNESHPPVSTCFAMQCCPSSQQETKALSQSLEYGLVL